MRSLKNLCMWELGNHSQITLHRNFFVFKSLFHPKCTWKPSLLIRNDKKNVFLMNIAFISQTSAPLDVDKNENKAEIQPNYYLLLRSLSFYYSLEKILGGGDCDYANILSRGMNIEERKFKRPSLQSYRKRQIRSQEALPWPSLPANWWRGIAPSYNNFLSFFICKMMQPNNGEESDNNNKGNSNNS